MTRTVRTYRRAATALVSAGLAVGLVGCGGDDTDRSSGETSSAAQDDAADELPEGFPQDVPLPGYSGAKTIASGDGGVWGVLLMLSEPTQTPVEDYAAQLSDAGYTLEDGPSGSKDAEGPDWDISFHSSLENTLTVTVIAS